MSQRATGDKKDANCSSVSRLSGRQREGRERSLETPAQPGKLGKGKERRTLLCSVGIFSTNGNSHAPDEFLRGQEETDREGSTGHHRSGQKCWGSRITRVKMTH